MSNDVDQLTQAIVAQVKRELNLDERQSAMDRLVGEMKKMMSALQLRDHSVAEVESRLVTMCERMTDAARKMDHQEMSLVEAATNLGSQIAELDHKIAGQALQGGELAERISRTRETMLEEYLTLKSKVNRHEEEVSRIMHQACAEAEGIEKKHTDCAHKVAVLDTRIAECQSWAKQVTAAKSDLMANHKEITQTLTQLQQSLLESLREERDRSEARIQETFERLAQREAQSSEAQRSLSTAVDRTEGMYHSIREEVQRVDRDLEHKAGQVNERFDHAANSLKKLLRHVEDIKSEPEQVLQQATSKVDRIRAMIEAASEANAELQSSIRQSEQSLHSLSHESMRTYREYQQMQQDAVSTLGDLILHSETATQQIEYLKQTRAPESENVEATAASQGEPGVSTALTRD